MQDIPWTILQPIVKQEERITAAANIDVAIEQLRSARRRLKEDAKDPSALAQLTALIASLRAVRLLVWNRIRNHRQIPPSAP